MQGITTITDDFFCNLFVNWTFDCDLTKRLFTLTSEKQKVAFTVLKKHNAIQKPHVYTECGNLACFFGL